MTWGILVLQKSEWLLFQHFCYVCGAFGYNHQYGDVSGILETKSVNGDEMFIMVIFQCFWRDLCGDMCLQSLVFLFYCTL